MGDNVLVVGKAKTGTTVISKAIQHSMPGAAYHLEPKSILFFEHGEHVTSTAPRVVKIIFEHWNKTPRLRDAIIHNEAAMKFSKRVAILRDPRDELISRLYYLIFPYFRKHAYSDEVLSDWISIFLEKENTPDKISFLDMIEKIKELTGSTPLSVLNFVDLYWGFLEQNQEQMHLCRYEDFIAGDTGELEEYLGFELSCERDVGKLSRTSRTRSSNNWKTMFLDCDVRYFQQLLGNKLERMGYTDWVLEPDGKLDPETGSSYIRKLAEMAREIGDASERTKELLIN